MAVQPKWDKYEAVILIDALFRSLNGEMSRRTAAQMVSDEPRQRALD